VPARTYVIGDIGGHLSSLEYALARAGIRKPSLRLPPDVYVVQVGDLIDRGPFSYECVVLAHQVASANPGRYIQLAGNHEANWISLHNHFNTDSDSAAVNEILSWTNEGGMYLAAYIERPEPWLLTHAGLTRGVWESLSCPGSVADSAKAINDAWENPLFYNSVAKPGMILGNPVSNSAGVFWSDAARELIPSWDGHEMPFNQAHGHSVPWDYYRHNWKVPASAPHTRFVNEDRRHVTTKVANMSIVSIDPCLGVRGNVPFEPLMIPGPAAVRGAPLSIH